MIDADALRDAFRFSNMSASQRALWCSAYPGNELRCHELARAVHLVVHAREYKLVVVDGKCGPIEHSWIHLSDGVILDPYVPGRMPAVQLVDLVVGTAYRPGAPRDDIRQAVV